MVFIIMIALYSFRFFVLHLVQSNILPYSNALVVLGCNRIGASVLLNSIIHPLCHCLVLYVKQLCIWTIEL